MWPVRGLYGPLPTEDNTVRQAGTDQLTIYGYVTITNRGNSMNKYSLRETRQQKQPQQHFYTQKKTELLPYLQQASDKWHNTDTIQATYYGSVYTSGSRRAVSDIKRR